jgi:hypothetical protein
MAVNISSAISSEFNQAGAQFVLIGRGKKFPPIEKEWQNKVRTFQEALIHKGNIGIMAGNGYIGLDQDDPNAFECLEPRSTTKWETRPGRFGLWFKCNDVTSEILAKYGFKPDQAQIKLYDSKQVENKIVNGKEKKYCKPCGEIKLERTYQVIPPSWKEIEGKRVDYKMVEEVPPAEVSLDWLLAELQRIGIIFHETVKPSKRNLSSSNSKDKTDKISHKNAGTSGYDVNKYAEAALEDEIAILSNTPEGSRNDQLNKSAFALGQLIAAGRLDESRVVEELQKAASGAGLAPEEIERTIQSGLESGKKQPRKVAESRDWKNEIIVAITYLAGCCDGAKTIDKTGFNKKDTKWGKDLADRIGSGQPIEDRELKYASKRINKYKKQLSNAGIALPEIPQDEGGSDSIATLIVKKIFDDGAELWHSDDGKAYITFEIDGHKENHLLESNAIKGWLAKRVYEVTQKTPSNQAIQDALNVLRGMALYDGLEYLVYVRVAPCDRTIYVDLGTP